MANERRKRGRPPHPDILTPREWQVLDLLREGLSNEQIASRLDISLATAKYHVSEILSKVGAATREEAAAWQPPAKRGWLERALAPLAATLRRLGPLTPAKAAIAATAVAAAVGLAVLAWALLRPPGERGDAAERPVKSATPLVASPPPELAATGYQIVFIRGLEAREGFNGELWISDLDGSAARQLTPEDVAGAFAGFLQQEGRDLIYYIAHDSEKVRTLWEVDLGNGVGRNLLQFQARWPFESYASLSPDGRYIAYTDLDSVRLLDLQTGDSQPVLTGNGAACDLIPNVGECFVYRDSEWSPDGRFLLVQKVFYEGGHWVVIDLQQTQPPEIALRQVTNPSRAAWSPSGNAICAFGQYAAPSGLFVARAPDWTVQRFFADFETGFVDRSPVEGRTVTSCSWLSDKLVLYSTTAIFEPAMAELRLLDLETGADSYLSGFMTGRTERAWSRQIIHVPGSRYAVTQYFRGGGSDEVPGQPAVLDLVSGAGTGPPGYAVLEEGDWVVAIVPASTR